MSANKILGFLMATAGVICIAYVAQTTLLQPTNAPTDHATANERGPDAITQDPRKLLALGKGVQHYCVKNFELASCLAYAVDCGRECGTLLTPPVRKRMLSEYNRHLIAKGSKPIVK